MILIKCKNICITTLPLLIQLASVDNDNVGALGDALTIVEEVKILIFVLVPPIILTPVYRDKKKKNKFLR